MDEITLTGETTISEIKDGKVETYKITPEQFGLNRASMEDLRGGDGAANAEITRNILKGTERGAKRDIVLLNAGATLYTGGIVPSIAEGVKLAGETIDSGKAYETLQNLIRVSNEK
jgi:anthranilate phosphoribosyltransferase